MSSLDGKVAIVTGASRGLGSAMALELARQGASVLLVYTSESSKSKVDALIHEITSLPHSPLAHSTKTDLYDPEAPNEILRGLDAWLGSGPGSPVPVDILVNNAGIDVQKPVDEITPADFSASYDLNVRAPILLTGALVPRLKLAAVASSSKSQEADKGHSSSSTSNSSTSAGSRIINVGSVGGRLGFANLSLYCSSKAALEGLTRSWAAELGADGTTVNQVNPGPVRSDMLDRIPADLVETQRQATPVQNRLGTAEEVARIVAWLASPSAAWVSGQVLSASGGYAMY